MLVEMEQRVIELELRIKYLENRVKVLESVTALLKSELKKEKLDKLDLTYTKPSSSLPGNP